MSTLQANSRFAGPSDVTIPEAPQSESETPTESQAVSTGSASGSGNQLRALG